MRRANGSSSGTSISSETRHFASSIGEGHWLCTRCDVAIVPALCPTCHPLGGIKADVLVSWTRREYPVHDSLSGLHHRTVKITRDRLRNVEEGSA